MKANPKYAKVVAAMARYDRTKPGAPERAEAGAELDKEGSRLSGERDFFNAVAEYVRAFPEACKEQAKS